MDIKLNNYDLNGLEKINTILGKNGSGKSTLLTIFETELKPKPDYHIKYITPERAGTLKYDPNVERNVESSENWLSENRRKNQTTQFKEQSIYQYRKLQLLFYKELEADMNKRKDENYNFENIILGKINSLLENIEVRPVSNGLETYKRGTTTKIQTDKISSGESELISIAIECLVFIREAEANINNYLLLDEPDVHLHPDLQYKLGLFLREITNDNNVKIILATHSTAFVGAFTDYQDATFGLIKIGQTEINFKKISNVYKKILPVFAAHPLSNIFNQSPIFLVEGEDDLRIWQQSIRTSQGKLKIYPVDIDGIDHFSEYENNVIEIINSIYDSPRAYSLRDRDETDGDIQDMPPLLRFKLNCRAAENLILTDEVLEFLGLNWGTMKGRLDKWIETREDHPRHSKMQKFKESNYNRLTFKLKDIRNIIIGETGTSKPWEVAIGQVIGKLIIGEIPTDYSENKIAKYLGKNLLDELIS